MTLEYLSNNLKAAISDSGIHRLIICAHLKISLAMLDDFIQDHVRMPSEKLELLLQLINKEVVYQ